MSKVLIIGCGGVASVAIHKCCQVPEVFTDICIASRTKSKCDKLCIKRSHVFLAAFYADMFGQIKFRIFRGIHV